MQSYVLAQKESRTIKEGQEKLAVSHSSDILNCVTGEEQSEGSAPQQGSGGASKLGSEL